MEMSKAVDVSSASQALRARRARRKDGSVNWAAVTP
jgi:hypothetical protein